MEILDRVMNKHVMIGLRGSTHYIEGFVSEKDENFLVVTEKDNSEVFLRVEEIGFIRITRGEGTRPTAYPATSEHAADDQLSSAERALIADVARLQPDPLSMGGNPYARAPKLERGT